MEELEAGLLTECCELLNTISTYPENKKCFDCSDNYSPRYLCATFSTFVCSCCANIHHKEFGHSIKTLSIFSFTLNEIYVLKETGNRVAADKWLSRWRADLFSEPDPTSPTYKEDARKYMKAKYIEKRWVKLSPPLPGISELGYHEGEPRGYEDVSPRKVIPDGAVPAEPDTVSQQHEEKSFAQPHLRDPYSNPAPYMYMPQPMYIPVSMPGMPQMGMPPVAMPSVPQYAYPQYHMQQPDVSQQSYYGPYTSYNYPYENMHRLPPIMQEGVSWPGAYTKTKKRPVTTHMQPQRELTSPVPFSAAEECPPSHPGAILRSVSDNSLVTTYVLEIPNNPNNPNKRESMTIIRDCVSDSKLNYEYKTETKVLEPPPPYPTNKADTVTRTSSKSDSKIKLSGIMNKVAGFLGKKS